MANEIKTTYITGKTLYFIVMNNNGELWNGSAFEAIDTDNWTNYDVPMTEQDGTEIYFGSFPVGITNAGQYILIAYERVGVSPNAVNDIEIKTGEINWDGASEVTGTDVSSVLTVVNSIFNLLRAKIFRG